MWQWYLRCILTIVHKFSIDFTHDILQLWAFVLEKLKHKWAVNFIFTEAKSRLERIDNWLITLHLHKNKCQRLICQIIWMVSVAWSVSLLTWHQISVDNTPCNVTTIMRYWNGTSQTLRYVIRSASRDELLNQWS